MKYNLERNELFQSSHISILSCYTILSVILIAETLLMSWEIWAIFPIVAAVGVCWGMHIQHIGTETFRIWVFSVLMMVTFFFYGIHTTSTYDLATVMAPVMILYTMTGIKGLITLCQVTYYITLIYGFVKLIIDGAEVDALMVSRTVMHIAMMFVVSWLARLIIDKWLRVLGRSDEEIEQLTDATDRLNDFLANVSHEIRTPINAVIGLSGVCAEKTAEPELHADLLDINEAGRRVAEQISDILDYSEIDRHKLARNDEDFMLASVINDLVNELRDAKPEEIELVIDIDPSIPAVMNTDVSKLKKILRHLIVNGLKYTREGGVYVRISSIPEDYGVNLCIEVSDTGIGMTAEELERMSERFYQANSSRTRSSSGLGLGMAIVSGFVSSLGGFMTLDSKYGVGTTVRVSIPSKVVDDTICMSVAERDKLCLGAYLHFEKYRRPEVREYYNLMVRNIVRGLCVQMHRVDNEVNLKKLLSTVKLTHLFVGEDEYIDHIPLMEELAGKMKVIVVANGSIKLPERSKVRVMEKPFYCFPVTAMLNEGTSLEVDERHNMRCVGVKALVVDDEPMNLTVARSLFGKYGMIVSTATSGKESIKMCSEQEFDIVFMDHMMPGMDGVEAMKRIRTDPQRARNDLPIVALTANAVSTAKEMFLREGFDGFVSKPVDLIELERVLKKVLPKSMITYEDEEPENVRVKAAPVREKPSVRESTAPAPAAQEAPAQADSDSPYAPIEKCGVDISAGLKYCMNDEEFYKTLLTQFATESDDKRAGMEKHFASKNFTDYEILVHALKSTSKMIGCMGLSESAKALEFAAKDSDGDYIAEHHAEVMERYKQLTDAIKLICGTGGETDDAPIEFEPQDDKADAPIEFEPQGDKADEGIVFEPDGESGEVFEFLPQDKQ